MADPEQVAILKQGVDVWNKWRKEHPRIEVDFRGADLVGANLAGMHFSWADLREADLNGANLSGANLKKAHLGGTKLRETNLRWADLTGARLGEAYLSGANLSEAELGDAYLRAANLRKAELRGVNLSGADLKEATLDEANLSGTNLSGADLSETEFSNAVLWKTVFVDVDLRRAKGLEAVRHLGPSHIGIDTIYKSRAEIPDIFLRGAGVPDNFITFMKSLARTAIEFYSCFISYSTKDQDFAERLYADLQANNVRCWFAPHDIQGGKKIHEQIDEAIRMHDKLLLILSPNSIKSAWVETEIAKARKREVKDEQRVLFPVRLVDIDTLKNWECFDADTGKDSAREIREFFIPDFSDWKNHDSYQKAFQRLLRDLKEETVKRDESGGDHPSR
jgi:uncharacterized protein YjbI with pentapeptide repeats